jgi:hypothetical protein
MKKNTETPISYIQQMGRIKRIKRSRINTENLIYGAIITICLLSTFWLIYLEEFGL